MTRLLDPEHATVRGLNMIAPHPKCYSEAKPKNLVLSGLIFRVTRCFALLSMTHLKHAAVELRRALGHSRESQLACPYTIADL